MTNQTNAQQTTDASELLFRSMTENSADIILRKDSKRRITYISSSIQRITGYRQEQLLNHHLAEFVLEEDLPALNAAHKTALENASLPVALEFRLKQANGTILWMEGTAVNMLNIPGVASIIVNIRDVTNRKLADQKLLASEIKFRSLIENSHDGIALMNPEGKMVYLSPAIERVMGFNPSELLGTDPRLLSHPDDLAPVANILRELYQRPGGTATAVYRMIHKNGDWRWIKSNITNLLHEEHIGAFVFNYEDITERRTAEALLRQSERMMADAQKIAHFGSWELDITDEGYGGLRWSEEVFRIFGYAPRGIDVTVEKFFNCVYPEDLPAVQGAMLKALAENARYSIDHRIVWPDGSVRWVHEDAQLIDDDINAEFAKMLGTVRDITVQKDAEDRLLKSEANLKAIFDNTEIAYAMLDKDLNIVTFNPRAAKWVHTICNEKLSAGTAFLSYIKDHIEAARLKVLLKKALEGEQVKFDYNSFLPDGGEMWYLTQINPVVAPNGNVYGACIAISDITLRKQHEIEREKITNDLIQRNKDLEQFTYVISHNLRAPLTNMIGLSQLMLEDAHTGDFQEIYAKQLLLSVQKMDVIIKDLGQVLQIKKEMGEVKQLVHFSELTNDIMLSIENIITQENVTLTTDFTAMDDFLTVKSYMYSIFYNLITNSIKYRQPGIAPIIDVKSIVWGNKLQLVFSDNGLGIDLKRKGKEVFGLYKRFHHHIEGKGMGLFMVKTQVETLGGQISIESEINKGTKFTMSFPLG